MTEIEKKRLAPASSKQKEVLTEFMQRHEELVSGRFSQEFTKKKAQELWSEISLTLNSIPGGSQKTWVQWRKTWQDMKKHVKSKVVAEKRYATGTGGGPAKVIKFDNTEAKILSFLPPKATFGDVSVPTPNVIFDFGQSSSQVEESIAAEETADSASSIKDPNIEVKTIQGIAETHSFTTQHEGESSKTPKKTAPPTKRFTKTKRLENSLQVSTDLVKIEAEKKDVLVKYYEEKTNYLVWRREYEKEKLKVLQKNLDVQEQILAEMKRVKECFPAAQQSP